MNISLDEIKSESKKVKDVQYLDDHRDSMVKGFVNGYELGKTTYFNGINPHFRWLKKNLIMFAGYGNHGKSAMLNQLLLLRALNDNEKFAIFSPENMPVDHFYNDIIHTLIGKSTMKQHHNQMSMIEYEAGMEFVKEHFFLLYPETESPTPEYINDRFLDAIVKHGVDGCVIDPFNQLENDWEKSGRDDKYLSSFLGKEKMFAQRNDVYKIIVGHCKSPRNPITDDGVIKEPNVFDLAHGAMWNNKIDDILFVHRPYKISEPDNTMALFTSAKIKKQRICGRPGTVQVHFDPMKNRFYMENEDPFTELDKHIKEKMGI